MNRVIAYVLVAVAMMAAPLSAQAPDGPRGRGAWPQRGPVEKLIENREKLGLTAEQVRQLTQIDREMAELNRPLIAELWEMRRQLRGESRVRPRDMTPEQRREMQRHFEQARPLLERIRENNRVAMQRVGQVLTAEQKQIVRRELLRRGRGEGDGRRKVRIKGRGPDR